MPSGRATGRGFVAAALFVSATLGTSALWAASPENRAAARQHLAQAQQSKKQGRLAEACQELREVERLDPKLPTLIELAECTEQLGKLVEAQDLWSLARDRAKHDEKPQSRARAEERLAALQKRIAHLTLQLTGAAGAQVLRDDVPLEAASLGSAMPIDPGEHVVVVKQAGHDDAKYAVKLAQGDNQTLAIAAGPASSGQTAPPAVALAAPVKPTAPAPASLVPAPATTPDAPHPSGWWSTPRKLGAVLGGVGVVAIGGGTALCLSGDGNEADASLALGGAAIATGGVLLLSGVLLLISGSSDEAAQHARLRVTPTWVVASGGTMLGAAGEF
jgi:hypothetical protein